MPLRWRIVFSIMACIPGALVLSGCIGMIFDTARLTRAKAEQLGWQQLADSGDAEAQYKVGMLYCCGERPQYDNVEALRWWCKAARNGQRDAQHEVARMFEHADQYKGNVIPKDLVMAHVYYVMAAKNGSEDAAAARDSLAQRLSEEERKQSAVMQQRWPNVFCEVSR